MPKNGSRFLGIYFIPCFMGRMGRSCGTRIAFRQTIVSSKRQAISARTLYIETRRGYTPKGDIEKIYSVPFAMILVCNKGHALAKTDCRFEPAFSDFLIFALSLNGIRVYWGSSTAGDEQGWRRKQELIRLVFVTVLRQFPQVKVFAHQ